MVINAICQQNIGKMLATVEYCSDSGRDTNLFKSC